MMKIALTTILPTAFLLSAGAGAIASAQDVLLVGHVQRVVLQPPGTDNCPPACPALETRQPDGSVRVCISNAGGCAAMDVKVDRVYAGQADAMRTFKERIGEFGSRFPLTDHQVIVSQEGDAVHVALVTERDGKQFIDPKRLWKFGGLAASSPGDESLVELDVVLARLGLQR